MNLKKNKYMIHFNGGIPFSVTINDQNVKVYLTVFGEKRVTCESEPILQFQSILTFIGKSPRNKMTEYSGAHGKNFDGNSILLQIDSSTYVFIGSEIFSFKAENQIVDFVSPVGNSDVPYPYAFDNDGNCYLLIENVMIQNNEQLKEYDNPYDFYYDHNFITPHQGTVPPNFQGIDKFYINGKISTLTYKPDPETEFERLVSYFGEPIYAIDIQGNKTVYNKSTFSDLHKSFGSVKGFRSINRIRTLHNKR